MDARPFFREQDGFIYLKIPHCEFYIPTYYFDSTAKFAEDLGQKMKALGLFNIGLYPKGSSTPQIETLKLPTWIEMFIYDSEIKDIKLPWSESPIQCKVLHYYEGNKVMPSDFIQDSSNAESFLGLILSGKLPVSLPCDKSPEIWEKNQHDNDVDLGLPAVAEELILSVVYRDKNDLSKKFSKVLGQNDNDTSIWDCIQLSIRRICQYSSTFTAMTFEDFDAMAVTSLNRSRKNQKEIDSPLEEIIKM